MLIKLFQRLFEKRSAPDVLELLRTHLFQGPAGPGRTVRWDANAVSYHVTAPSPNNRLLMGYHDLVPKAIATLNSRLTEKIKLQPASTQNQAQIRIIFGTAIVPDPNRGYQNYIACTSKTAKMGDDIACDAHGRIVAPVYIDIGHQHVGCDCVVTVETVIHELGHALGIKHHFPGFGDGPELISETFWSMLATLYSHGPGTPIDNICEPVRASV